MWPFTAHANSITLSIHCSRNRHWYNPHSSCSQTVRTLPVIIGRTPERSKPALLAANVPALLKDPSGEKPALLTAKVLSGEKPALVAARCQRCHRSEQCDELQHGSSLLYLSAPS